MPESAKVARPAPSPLREAKRALRNRVVAARAAMGEPARVAASRRITELVTELPEFRAAKGVHCFLSLPGEIDTAALFAACAAAGKATFVPIQMKAERRLECVAWRPGDPIFEGPFGVREPPPDRRSPADLGAIDLVLAPGAAFDHAGHRLGYGMGYYDGFLKTLADRHGSAGWIAPGQIARPAVVALAFAVQIVESIPLDPWDVRLPTIVTEEGIIRVSSDNK